MKLFILILLLLIPTKALAVSGDSIKDALYAATKVELVSTFQVAVAIETILDIDPLGKRRKMSNHDILFFAKNIERASIVSGQDWKLILAISYVESSLCHKNWIEGDESNSFGCMQVNLRWWGSAIRSAGLNSNDLLRQRYGIIIGALVLRQKVNQYGWKEGIRRYNGTGIASREYQAKILSIIKII